MTDISDTNSDTITPDTNNDDNDNDEVVEIDQIELSTKEKLYFRYISKFFKKLSIEKIDEMINIIESKSRISLRLLDWFVTRYSNKYKTSYEITTDNNEKEMFYVHIGYKSQLKSYKKRYFDPFRRKKKFMYYFNAEKTRNLATTIGQLNFFRWVFSHNIIEYVKNKYDDISTAMILANKEDKKRKKEKNQKQSPLSKKSINNTNTNSNTNNTNNKNEPIKIILSFD